MGSSKSSRYSCASLPIHNPYTTGYATNVRNTATYGTTKASAHVYSAPLRLPRRKRQPVSCRTAGRRISATDAVLIVVLPHSCHRVLGEDLLDPLEGLVDRRLRLRAILRHVDHRVAQHVLRADFRHRHVVDVVVGPRRAEDPLLRVAPEVRILRVLPEGAL